MSRRRGRGGGGGGFCWRLPSHHTEGFNVGDVGDRSSVVVIAVAVAVAVVVVVVVVVAAAAVDIA